MWFVLEVEIEKQSAVPIYAQLQDQIRLLIRRGALATGARAQSGTRRRGPFQMRLQ